MFSDDKPSFLGLFWDYLGLSRDFVETELGLSWDYLGLCGNEKGFEKIGILFEKSKAE